MSQPGAQGLFGFIQQTGLRVSDAARQGRGGGLFSLLEARFLSRRERVEISERAAAGLACGRRQGHLPAQLAARRQGGGGLPNGL